MLYNQKGRFIFGPYASNFFTSGGEDMCIVASTMCAAQIHIIDKY